MATKNIQLSEEELNWVIMSIESTINIREDALSWFQSQGDWAAAEKEKDVLNTYRKLHERLDIVAQS